ncbi:MAG: hypothetical protein ACJAWC_001040 [Yoonia sp.]|jgi:hypothetical protein
MHYFVRITIIDYCALIPQNERINIADRRSSILAVTRRDGTASATDLVDTLGFAVPTIWRNRYRNERLELGHSAAVLASGMLNIDYDNRRTLGRDAKLQIGARTTVLMTDNTSFSFISVQQQGQSPMPIARTVKRSCDQ